MGKSKKRSKKTYPFWLILILIAGSMYFELRDRLFEEESSRPQMEEEGESLWWHVFFTEPKERFDVDDVTDTILGNLIAYIDAAKQSIHIAAFEFNLLPVAKALITAQQRGVEIRWIADNEHGIEDDEEKGERLFPMLKSAGISVRDDRRKALMHNKFLIFDQHIVWTGSTNITINCMFRNNNNTIVIQSSELAEIYEREFEELWAGQSGSSSPSTVSEQSLSIAGSEIQVLFAPEDDVADQLIDRIAEAKHSIRFMAFSFTHDGLGEAVLSRAKAGIDVQGIFEKRGSSDRFSELSHLYCSGVSVRVDGNPAVFHHKVFILDEETVMTGSFNFSRNANEKNDENMIIIKNAQIASRYLSEFDQRWAEAADPDRHQDLCQNHGR